MSQKAETFVLQSKTDNEQFIIDKKIMDSSSLLQNINSITKITEPIVVNCSGKSLKFFIDLINHYQNIGMEEHDFEFEKNLFVSSTKNEKEELIKLIQDLCILDSDFFLDSASDYILGILEEKEDSEKKPGWKNIQNYLGLENDFSEKEREFICKNELKYFLSYGTKKLRFPFPNKNLYSLKTDFSTPMNILIAKMVEHSNAKMAYLFSMINKTMKNEVDRHPIKVDGFKGSQNRWFLEISMKNRSFAYSLNSVEYSERYFNIIKNRKVIANYFSISFSNFEEEIPDRPIIQSNSFDFVISESVDVTFSRNLKSMYEFDISKCKCPSIFYNFNCVINWGNNFEEIYKHLISKDLTKEIKMCTFSPFERLNGIILIRFYKKANASKFHKLELRNVYKFYPEFKIFLKYMEDDGNLNSSNWIPEISLQIRDDKKYALYPVSVVKEHLKM